MNRPEPGPKDGWTFPCHQSKSCLFQSASFEGLVTREYPELRNFVTKSNDLTTIRWQDLRIEKTKSLSISSDIAHESSLVKGKLKSAFPEKRLRICSNNALIGRFNSSLLQSITPLGLTRARITILCSIMPLLANRPSNVTDSIPRAFCSRREVPCLESTVFNWNKLVINPSWSQRNASATREPKADWLSNCLNEIGDTLIPFITVLLAN